MLVESALGYCTVERHVCLYANAVRSCVVRMRNKNNGDEVYQCSFIACTFCFQFFCSVFVCLMMVYSITTFTTHIIILVAFELVN